MYNLVHYFIGFLAELGLISQEGAQAIDRELSPQIISSNAQEAFKQVHDTMSKVSKDLNLRGDLVKIEPWLAHIELLEKRVAELEGKHTSLQKDFNSLLTIVKEKLGPVEKEFDKVVKPIEAKVTGKSGVNKKPIAKAKS